MSGNLTISVLYMEPGEPFIFEITGKATVANLQEIEAQLVEDVANEAFPNGDGEYVFSVTHYEGQYGEYGRCEIAPGWEFDLIAYDRFDEPEGHQND